MVIISSHITSSLGFIIGPGFNFAFENIDVTWHVAGYEWRIMYANIPGLYMAALFVLVQVRCPTEYLSGHDKAWL